MLHIAAPARHKNVVAAELKAEGEKDLAHQALGQVGAEQGIDLLRLELHDRGSLVLGDDVHHAVYDLAAAEQLDQLAGTLHGLHGVHRVKTLFVARGGVGAHPEGRRRAADGHAVEVGALKEDHRRIADDLAVRAAHHARDAHGLVLVADAEHIRRELAVVAVEGLNDLALTRGADDDPAAVHAGEVEGVHRLAVLEHDVVRNVHDVVDRAHAGVAQALAHPLRGGRDLHVLHHARGVARAKLAVLDLDVDQLRDAAAAALDPGCVQLERAAEGRACLAGKANDGKAVGTVGRDLELDHAVVIADDLRDVVAGLPIILTQDEDAVGDAVRELALLGVQVGKRADGVGLGVVGHQIALVQVGADGVGTGGRAAEVETGMECAVALRRALEHLRRRDRSEHLVTGLDVGGDGGLGGVDGMIVVQKRRGRDDRVGEVVLGGQAQLLERAEHTVGRHAAQLTLFDLHAAGQHGLVQRRGHQIADVDVPRTGDDLHRLLPADVELADPHVVAVGVLFHGEDLARDHVFEALVQTLDGLDLGAGERHFVVELLVGDVVEVNKFVEPISA